MSEMDTQAHDVTGELPDVEEPDEPIRFVGTIDIESARAQALALKQAADDSVVPQLRATLRRQFREWKRAVQLLRDLETTDFAIMVEGAVLPGMEVMDERHGACMVVRELNQGGQVSLHLENPDTGQPIYVNFAGPVSPVVVRL